MLSTGARIGEALALRWCDIDLASAPPRLTISGTIVEESGSLPYRKDSPKTRAGYRTLILPDHAISVLEQRVKPVRRSSYFRLERWHTTGSKRSPLLAPGDQRHRIRMGKPSRLAKDRGHPRQRRHRRRPCRPTTRAFQRRRHTAPLYPARNHVSRRHKHAQRAIQRQ